MHGKWTNLKNTQWWWLPPVILALGRPRGRLFVRGQPGLHSETLSQEKKERREGAEGGTEADRQRDKGRNC